MISGVACLLRCTGSNQSFNERMQRRRVGHRLDLLPPENAQIGLPSVILEQVCVANGRRAVAGQSTFPSQRD